MNGRNLTIFNQSRHNPVSFDLSKGIASISKNREKIPDRYWSGEHLNIAMETVSLERQDNLITTFIMVGRKGDMCRMTVTSENYKDVHECGGAEFGSYVAQIGLSSSDAKKLKELYILTKEDVDLSDLLNCENMEIRRDAIKKMGYDKVRKHAMLIDEFDEYELIDLRYGGEDFGRFLKMIDSTSKETYLLQVPRTRDFGTIKIPMNKATQALAWSFGKQEHEYHPVIET